MPTRGEQFAGVTVALVTPFKNGEVDFDNFYRWAAPWEMLRSGKIVVLPAVRRMTGRHCAATPHEPLRPRPEVAADHVEVAVAKTARGGRWLEVAW